MNGGVGSLNACHVATQMMRRQGRKRADPGRGDREQRRFGPEEHVGLMEMGSALLLEPTSGPEGFGRFVFRSFPAHGDA